MGISVTTIRANLPKERNNPGLATSSRVGSTHRLCCWLRRNHILVIALVCVAAFRPDVPATAQPADGRAAAGQPSSARLIKPTQCRDPGRKGAIAGGCPEIDAARGAVKPTGVSDGACSPEQVLLYDRSGLNHTEIAQICGEFPMAQVTATKPNLPPCSTDEAVLYERSGLRRDEIAQICSPATPESGPAPKATERLSVAKEDLTLSIPVARQPESVTWWVIGGE